MFQDESRRTEGEVKSGDLRIPVALILVTSVELNGHCRGVFLQHFPEITCSKVLLFPFDVEIKHLEIIYKT